MNILTFFAHPDDETMLAGGTLALLARLGADVHYLCATRGEGGEVGEPPVCEEEELGQVREEEMLCAVQALGGRSLTFLGYTDPRVGPDDQLFPYSEDLTMLAGQVIASIRQYAVDAVITHGSNGEYGHPAHEFSFQAARIAVESLGAAAPLLYSVGALYPDHPQPILANKDDAAHLILDVQPALDAKTSAALCHRSQHALFVRRASEASGRIMTVPEVILPAESLHRHLPRWTSSGIPDDPLAQMLAPYSVRES